MTGAHSGSGGLGHGRGEGPIAGTLSRGVGLAVTALLTSSATLICCVLPAVLVSLGAGATLVSLVSAFPELVWLSEHKPAVFGAAGATLAVAGVFLWRARRLPCPTDPAAARQCLRLRGISSGLYVLALVSYAMGMLFAFVLPLAAR